MIVTSRQSARSSRWRRFAGMPLPKGLVAAFAQGGVLSLVVTDASGPLVGIDAGIIRALAAALAGVALLWLIPLRLVVPGDFAPYLRGGRSCFVLAVMLFGVGLNVIGPTYLILRPAPLVKGVGEGLLVAGYVTLLIGSVVWWRWANRVRRSGVQTLPTPDAHPRLAVAASVPLIALMVGLVAWFVAEAPTFFPLYTLNGPEGIDALAWSADGRYLAMESSAGPSGVLAVWDAAAHHQIWSTTCGNVLGSVAWSADGVYVAAGCGYEAASGRWHGLPMGVWSPRARSMALSRSGSRYSEYTYAGCEAACGGGGA